MALLTYSIPVNLGVLTPGAAVASTDTVSVAGMGPRGAYLEILNGNASPDNVTITDAGSSPGLNPVTSIAQTVTNATNRTFFIHRGSENPTTGLVTVTHSVTATVTYKLYPA